LPGGLRNPHGLLLEVDYQEELPDEFYALLAGPDVPSFVLFGEEDTVRGMRMKLDEMGRTDVATLYVLHGLPQGKPSYGPRSKAFKSDVLTALIGGLPLDCDSPPYIANLDYPTPTNGYVEFAYLLNIMKDTRSSDKEVGRLMYRAHPSRSPSEALSVAAWLTGALASWTFCVVLSGTPAGGAQDEIQAAFDHARPQRAWTTKAAEMLAAGEQLQLKYFDERGAVAALEEQKRVAELKAEMQEMAKRRRHQESQKPKSRPPKAERQKKPKKERASKGKGQKKTTKKKPAPEVEISSAKPINTPQLLPQFQKSCYMVESVR